MPRDVHEPIECVEEDLLGRRALAERIYARLCGDECPQAIGIYGGWGTGKTSLLKLLEAINRRDIETNQKEVHFTVVDAWTYENGGSLLIPVIVRLKELLGVEKLSHGWKALIGRALTASALTVFDILLRRYANLDGQEIKDAYDKAVTHDANRDDSYVLLEWKKLIDDIEETKKAFEEIIEKILKKKKLKRIVLCIDNLDRCSPERAVILLESIKNFFSVPGCVWVLAVDSEVIASYISKKYEGTKVDGYSYLDKVIPEQYHLSLSPSLDRIGILNLLRSNSDHHVSIDEEKIPQIPKILVPRRLIKSASKIREYYRLPLETRPSPEIIINLTFLYHTWPAFYQRLSSDSREYLCGILGNFVEKETKQKVEGLEKEAQPVSLDQAFLEDRELSYFIQTAFLGKKEELSDGTIAEIIIGLRGLRQVGLP